MAPVDIVSELIAVAEVVPLKKLLTLPVSALNADIVTYPSKLILLALIVTASALWLMLDMTPSLLTFYSIFDSVWEISERKDPATFETSDLMLEAV